MPKVKEKHKEKRKLQILKAAYLCFSKKGYHNTSMRDIFKAASLSSGAVYNYFGSKEEIVQELVLKSQQTTKDLIKEVVNNSDGKDLIHDILLDHFERMDHPDAISGIRADVSIWAAALTDKKLMELTKKAFSDTAKQFSSAIKQRKTKKSGLDPNSIAQLMIAIIQGLTIQKMLNPEFRKAPYQKAVLAFFDSLYVN